MWKTRLILLRISKYAILITFSLSVIFAGFTIYGIQVGNFNISIEETSGIALSLYKTENFSDPTSRLSFGGMREQTNTTLSNIPENIAAGLGNKSDTKRKTYLAYGFLLRNESEVTFSYDMTIDITGVTKNVDAALRVMVITDGAPKVYAKPKDAPLEEVGQPEDYPYLTIPFVSPIMACKETVVDFSKGGVVNYTVVMWLEGWDAQCVDDIKGGIIKMEMNFHGYM